MEEKSLIKSERYNVKKLFMIMVIIGIVLGLLSSFASMFLINYYHSEYVLEHVHDRYCYKYEYLDEFDNDKWAGNIQEHKMDCPYVAISNAKGNFGYYLSGFLKIAGFWTLIGGFIYLWLRNYELTVTDKRIYGRVALGKIVDLPVDSISATAKIRFLKGVSVSTSSGRISFRAIKNADEIYEVINNLLIERQQKSVNATVIESAPKTDEVEQIKKYKDLLDSGIITQEEFDMKKKQLLGL